ncbi:hypothetical protein IWQ60_004818 [Tieghemiomyces parasiticus]|uniref:U2 snRNP-associated SURP motif-containing protein n=1 Tax=Tieghemiomyces parasiticus TaxID=78921 RepID=A0A9W8ADJ6_9FUNG|nr:hypothetical protein IWQ60_004818 [Tieghemiomyces parasiticus]
MGFEKSKSKFGVRPNLQRNVFKPGTEKPKKGDTQKDAEDLDKVYAEFVASFEGEAAGQPNAKVFVRARAPVRKSVFDDDEADKVDWSSQDTPAAIYEPPLRAKPTEIKEAPESQSITQTFGKKKRNLDLFLEELKKEQGSREERGDDYSEKGSSGSRDTGDPTTTNLYVGNLCPETNEEALCRVFARFGPIGSIKVMWPRTQEEFDRNRNVGFISFMKRADAEKARKHMDGATFMGNLLHVVWSKAVPLPPEPIFVLEDDAATPSTGLPFNAQIPKVPTEVRVTIPKDKVVLRLIHRVIERLIKYGPAFEALLMDREWMAPEFAFLFAYDSAEHIYYRWKLYSVLQADSRTSWRTKPFQMFHSGPLWVPPEVPFDDYVGARASDSEADELEERTNLPKGKLGQLATKRLYKMLRTLTTERGSILKAMVFVVEHADAADQAAEIITASLVQEDIPPPLRLARLYLVSDILFNSSMAVPNAWQLRKSLSEAYLTIDARLKAEHFKHQVITALQAWEKWMIFPPAVTASLTGEFLKGTIRVKP